MATYEEEIDALWLKALEASLSDSQVMRCKKDCPQLQYRWMLGRSIPYVFRLLREGAKVPPGNCPLFWEERLVSYQEVINGGLVLLRKGGCMNSNVQREILEFLAPRKRNKGYTAVISTAGELGTIVDNKDIVSLLCFHWSDDSQLDAQVQAMLETQ
jgi:hypothetical protein